MGVRVNVRTTVDRSAMRAFVNQQVADGVRRAAGRVRDGAKDMITAAGRVDVGTLRNANVAEVTSVQGTRVTGRVVNDARHAEWNHEGTGVHGPRGTPIVPRRARVLRFRPRGSATYVFAPEVQGMRPVPFLTTPLSRLRVDDFTP